MNFLVVFLAVMGFVFGLYCFVMFTVICNDNKKTKKETERKDRDLVDWKEAVCDNLDCKNKALENRIDILEFKEKAKGEKFVIRYRKNLLKPYTVEVMWIYKNNICRQEFQGEIFTDIEVNGNYIECFYCEDLTCVKYADGYELVNMDMDVYKKAYPEKFAVKEETKAEGKENA